MILDSHLLPTDSYSKFFLIILVRPKDPSEDKLKKIKEEREKEMAFLRNRWDGNKKRTVDNMSTPTFTTKAIVSALHSFKMDALFILTV